MVNASKFLQHKHFDTFPRMDFFVFFLFLGANLLNELREAVRASTQMEAADEKKVKGWHNKVEFHTTEEEKDRPTQRFTPTAPWKLQKAGENRSGRESSALISWIFQELLQSVIHSCYILFHYRKSALWMCVFVCLQLPDRWISTQNRCKHTYMDIHGFIRL